MDLFKLATKQKLTYRTNKGLVTTEQLWDLSIDELDNLAISLEIEHKQSGKKSFIYKTTSKDKTAKLRFDIVLEVLNTKNEEEEAALESLETKKHNEKLLKLISEKQDEELKNLPISELMKKLK